MSLRLPIPLLWKLRIRLALSNSSPPSEFPSKGPRLIVCLAADYGNLGDVALTRALVQFAAAHLPAHHPYLLTAGGLFQRLKGVSRSSNRDDVVAIVGGGNMGDMYTDLEEARLQVVKAFPHNRIVSFPQSIDFSDTTSGRCALQRSRSIYESHPRLTLFARDTESHERMRAAFPGAKVCLAPDTVLSMPCQLKHERTIPLVSCIRSDKEAALSAERRGEILAALTSAVSGAVVTDTVVPGPRLDFRSYDQKLEELLTLFSRSRCVVTDRLHGLIFSVITQTPCVVIENNNHKIRSLVATWLPELSSVRLLSQPTAEEVLRTVKKLEGCSPVRPNLDAAFAPLAAALRE